MNLGPAVFVSFVCDLSYFLDSERCAHELCSRSAADQWCQKSARILTLTTFAHLTVAVVSMLVRSVNDEEIQVSSLVGMTRAAAIPMGALEAGDLIGETPTGKQARDVKPAEQTPDQKAEEIVKKILGSDLEKTIIEDLKRTVSKFFKLTNRLIRPRDRYPNLVQQVQQIQRGTVSPGVKPYSIPKSEELDYQARNIECGTLVHEPERTLQIHGNVIGS